MDTQSEPGYQIMHFVRFKTLKVKDDGHFDQTSLMMICEDNDPRLNALLECITMPEEEEEAKVVPHFQLGKETLKHVLPKE